MSIKSRSTKPRRKNRKLIQWTLLSLCVFSILFHKAILKGTIQLALRWSLNLTSQEKLVVSHLEFRGKKIVLKEVSLLREDYALHVDEIQSAFVFDKTRTYLELKIDLIHPEITFNTEKGNQHPKGVPLPIPGRHFGLKFDALYGVINNAASDLHDRLYFNLKSVDSPDHLGTLTISNEPVESSPPFLRLDCWHIGGEIFAEFQLHRSDLIHLRRLAHCLVPSAFSNTVLFEGELEGSGKIAYSLQDNLQNINGHFTVKSLHFSHEELGLHGKLESFEADIDYHPLEKESFSAEHQGDIFKGMQITASLSNGEIAKLDPEELEGWKFEDIDAHLLIMPRSEPSLTLNTTFVRGSEGLPLHIQGKGAVLSDNKYWLELECEGFKDKERDLHGFLSLCKPDQHQIIVQTDVQSLNNKHWSWIRGILEDVSEKNILGSMHSGQLKGVCTSTFHDGELASVVWRDCILKDVQYSFPSGDIEISLGSLISEGQLERDASRQWKLEKSRSSLSEGFCVIQNDKFPLELEHFHGEIHVQDHHLEPSRFAGIVSGLKTEAVFQQVEGIAQCALTLNGGLNRLFQVVPQNLNMELSTLFQLKDNLEWQGTLALVGKASKDELAFGGTLQDSSQPQGWFRSEKLSDESLTTLALIAGIQGEFLGELDIYGTYSPEKIECSLQTDRIVFQHPEYALTVSELGKKDSQLLHVDNRAECTYYWKTKQLLATLPITDAALNITASGMKLEHIAGKMMLENERLQCEECQIYLGDTQFMGALAMDWTQKEKLGLKWITQQAQGSISDLAGILKKDFLACTGEWFIEKNGLSIEGALHNRQWNGKVHGQMHLEHIDILVHNGVQITEGKGVLELDTDSPFIVIKEASAQLVAHDVSAGILKIANGYIPLYPGESGSIVCTIEEGLESYMHASAVVTNKQDGWSIQLDPKDASILGCAVEKCGLTFSQQGTILHLDAVVNVPLAKMASQCTYAQKLRWIDPKIASSLNSMNLSGSLKAQLQFDAKKPLRVQLASSDLSLNGAKTHVISCAAEWNQKEWTITRAAWDDLCLTAQAHMQENTIRIPSFECTYRDNVIVGDGIYSFIDNAGKGNYTLQAPTLVHFSQWHGSLKARGTWNLGNHKETGTTLSSQAQFFLMGDVSLEGTTGCVWDLGDAVVFEKVDAKIIDPKQQQQEICHVHAEQCTYDWKRQEFVTQGAQLALLPQSVDFCARQSNAPQWLKSLQMAEPLTIRCTAAMSEKNQSFEGKIPETQWNYLGYPLRVRDVKVRIQGARIETVGIVSFEHEKLLFRAQYNPGADNVLVAKISDVPDAEGLHLSFHKGGEGALVLNKVEGQLSGAHVNFQGEKLRNGGTLLKGGIAVDVRQILPLLPIEMKKKIAPMQLGAGYSFTGKIILPEAQNPLAFSGELKGENFEVLGNRYDHFLANVQGNQKEILFHDFRCSDRALDLEIKKMQLLRDKEDWVCQIPLLQMKDFRPSALRSVEGKSKAIKPFAITHFTLRNIFGRLGNLQSFIGEGILHFSNAQKRDVGVFDLPLNMLKDVGLDPSVLNPYSGDVALILQKGKLHLTELSQCFSEGGRSEFYFADIPSFIALDGKVNIHLRIKQNSMLKIIEPFTLSVTGTFEKLHYSLK